MFETLAKKHARLEAKILEQTQSTTLSSRDSVLHTSSDTSINLNVYNKSEKVDASTVTTVTNEDLVRYINESFSVWYLLSKIYIFLDSRLDYTWGGFTNGTRNYK